MCAHVGGYVWRLEEVGCGIVREGTRVWGWGCSGSKLLERLAFVSGALFVAWGLQTVTYIVHGSRGVTCLLALRPQKN